MNNAQPKDNSPPTQSYAPVSARRRIERPVAVSVLAFIGILTGSALLFCNAIAMVTDTIWLKHPERSSMPGTMPQDPMVMKFGAANALAIVVLSAILLGGCFAAISLLKPARYVILVWSIVFILCGVARTIGEIQYVGPANLAWVERNKPDEPAFASGQMSVAVVPKAIGILALYCILPGMFLIFWTRAEVKRAFETGGMERSS